jgi:hypothetical protein
MQQNSGLKISGHTWRFKLQAVLPRTASRHKIWAILQEVHGNPSSTSANLHAHIFVAKQHV